MNFIVCFLIFIMRLIIIYHLVIVNYNNMDELCEILVHKLTLMNSQKEKPLLSNKDKD